MKGGHQIAMALRAAYLTMHRRTDAHLAKEEVTADQFALLAALAEEKALTQQELVRRLSSDPNTVGAMLNLLEGRGILVRAPHPTDRRARTAALTPKGRRLFKKLWTHHKPLRACLIGQFNKAEARAFMAFLGRVSSGMADLPECKEVVASK